MIYKTKDEFKQMLDGITELELSNLFASMKELGYKDPRIFKWKVKYKNLKRSLIKAVKDNGL